MKGYCEIDEIQATGGGAYRFSDLMDKKYGIKFIKHDELISLVHGYLFMNNYKAFYYLNEQDQMEKLEGDDLAFPHISVNIGSGVSLLKVLSPDEISRVGGTLMGGGTLIGISKLLINVDNYNDILELAKKGNHTNVDLTIKDIYGGDSLNLNLNSQVVASSFGKIHEYINVDKMDKINKEDIATSLLTMICFHITQLASLLAKENKITKVYFFGNFSRRNSAAIRCLDQCMRFWDRQLSVRYNYYDGYLGSIGTLVELMNE